MLGPIIHQVPQLSQYYQSTAVALDTTRHELQTEGVNIPDTKQEQQEFEGLFELIGSVLGNVFSYS